MRIACIGDNCIDYYDETGEAFPGGNPVNVAVYLRRLGIGSAYLGAVGTDAYGEMLLNRLQEKGVDVSHVQVLPGESPLCHVAMRDGNRILGDYSDGVMEHFHLREKDFAFLNRFDMAVTGLWGRMETQLCEVKKLGIPVVFDGAERPFDPAGLIALPCADIAFFSDDSLGEEELRAKIRSVKALGPKIVVATRGAKGSLAFDGETWYSCASAPCKVTDTMGAGDSYIAGFLVSWLKKRPIPECMQAGSENAAVTIGYKGAW